MTFVSWADSNSARVSTEVPADFSGVCSCLEGHEEIHLRNGSQSFPVTVPLPLSEGNSLHLERLFSLGNCSQDTETRCKGPNSCHGNEGAIGTLFPWQQS